MQKQRSPARGLPWIVLIGLALLAVPRVVLHDLDIIQEGDVLNLFLVLVPPLIWIVVVVRARVPKPFLTLLVVGAFYGVFLALGHQVLWERSMGDGPRLGGNLQGRLPPGAEEFVIRLFATVSSLFTGLLAGAVTGLVAWGVARLLRSRSGSGAMRPPGGPAG